MYIFCEVPIVPTIMERCRWICKYVQYRYLAFLIVMNKWHKCYVCKLVFRYSHKCYDHLYIFSSLYDVFFGSIFINVELVHKKPSNFFYIYLLKFVLCVLLCTHIDGYVNISNIVMFHIIIVRNKWNCLYNMLFVCSAYVFTQHELCHSNMKNCY